MMKKRIFSIDGGVSMAKKRKVPLRKCIVTNEMKPKQEMIRIVRNKEGEVFIDTSGKKNGRGAYITMDKEIIERAEKENILQSVFNVSIDPTIYKELKELVGDS